MAAPTIMRAAQVRVRHVSVYDSRDNPAPFNGAATKRFFTSDAYFGAHDIGSINGDGGWTSAEIGDRMGEESEFTITFPNAAGSDGVLHRDRFLILNRTKKYRPGDEWFEFYEATGAGGLGKLLFVGTPTKVQMDREKITITGWDCLWLLKKERETAAAWFLGSAREAHERYTCTWRPVAVEDFANDTGTPRFVTGSNDAWGRINVVGSGKRVADLKPGAIRINGTTSTTGGSDGVFILGAAPFGKGARERGCHGMRAEATLIRSVLSDGNAFLRMGLYDNNAASILAYITIYGPEPAHVQCYSTVTDPSTLFLVRNDPVQAPAIGEQFTVAIEWRDRWVYFYLNDRLILVMPGHAGPSTTIDATAYIDFNHSAVATTEYLDVHAFSQRYLMSTYLAGASKGDLRLAVDPSVAGQGLIGTYYDDHDIQAVNNNAGFGTGSFGNGHLYLLNPSRTPYTRRLDPLQNTNYMKSPFPPPGPYNNDYWSVRWIGAIYLDLGTYDYKFRLQVDDRARLFIGNTQWDQPLIEDWTQPGHAATITYGKWLKAGNLGDATNAPSGSTGPLAGQLSGWYPIIIEYSGGVSPSSFVWDYSRSDGPTSWVPVNEMTFATFSPTAANGVKLAPVGIYEAYNRYDSHSAQLAAIRDQFGLQYRVTPRQLESGEFPGQIIPLRRVGRDTSYVLDSIEGVDIVTSIDAEEVVDRLLLDTQIDSRADGTSQVTQEALRPQATWDSGNDNGGAREFHASWPADYSSNTDINIGTMAEQRARSLMLLKTLAWEETGVRPQGEPAVLDTFPVGGAAALFKWESGDGVRLALPELGVEDASPRQIMSVRWPLTPFGIGRPNVGFRQRPRGFGEFLRSLTRTATGATRNPTPRKLTLTGSWGVIAGPAGYDNYTRVSIPYNQTITKAYIAVQARPANVTPYQLQINGVNLGLSVISPGWYDITNYVQQSLESGKQERRAYITFTGGTGTIEFQAVVEVELRD